MSHSWSGTTLTTGIYSTGITITNSNISTSSNLVWTQPSSSSYQYYNMSADPALTNLEYNIYFSEDDDKLLHDNIKSIDNKKLYFYCDFCDKDRLQPYEEIMELINNKTKFTISIDISDILTIFYHGVQFKSIQNNFSFNDNRCDFNELVVKMKFKKVVYVNHKLHISEKRKDKLKKIMEV